MAYGQMSTVIGGAAHLGSNPVLEEEEMVSFLRVAAFELNGETPPECGIWDLTVGEYLRANPNCLGATAAASGPTWIVVSEWTSAAANAADMDSADYQAVLETMAQKVCVQSDIEPEFLFEGDVAGHVR